VLCSKDRVTSSAGPQQYSISPESSSRACAGCNALLPGVWERGGMCRQCVLAMCANIESAYNRTTSRAY
jgi:hypothetical protein